MREVGVGSPERRRPEHGPTDAAAVAADLPFAAATIEDWSQRNLCATDSIAFTNVKVHFTET